jgi:acyl dehydratase
MTKELYFEDLSLGQIFRAGPVTVSAEEMIRFSRDNDPQYFHVDPEAAKESMFGGLVASGWQTAALTMRLLLESARFSGGAVGAGGDIRWPRPTRPGDSLTVESEIIDIAGASSRADRGLVTFRTTTFNQRGEAVQVIVAKLIVFTRAGRGALAGGA